MPVAVGVRGARRGRAGASWLLGPVSKGGSNRGQWNKASATSAWVGLDLFFRPFACMWTVCFLATRVGSALPATVGWDLGLGAPDNHLGNSAPTNYSRRPAAPNY